MGAPGPCPTYTPKTAADHGYGSCIQCGWTEAEHVIDQLLRALEAHQP